jgi:CRP-like cAMP-binding protein
VIKVAYDIVPLLVSGYFLKLWSDSAMEPLFSQTELLLGLNKQEIAALTPVCHQVDTLEAATVFSEGTPATHLYVITEGQVSSIW